MSTPCDRSARQTGSGFPQNAANVPGGLTTAATRRSIVAPPLSNGVKAPSGRLGFTLMEIMVVVGIIGLIMAMGVPTLYHMLHREGFGKTVTDVMELCSAARAQAILQGVTTEVVFHPGERQCELGAGVETSARQTGAPKNSPHTVALGDDLSIEMLDVNLLEYKNAPIARVHFFPNGTSDEMTLIMRSGVEWRRISLDITTGLASLDSDPSHWR
jgi:prepilin-type N-terminal cleavage/methylation domain-containing protein